MGSSSVFTYGPAIVHLYIQSFTSYSGPQTSKIPWPARKWPPLPPVGLGPYSQRPGQFSWEGFVSFVKSTLVPWKVSRHNSWLHAHHSEIWHSKALVTLSIYSIILYPGERKRTVRGSEQASPRLAPWRLDYFELRAVQMLRAPEKRLPLPQGIKIWTLPPGVITRNNCLWPRIQQGKHLITEQLLFL